MTNYWLCKQEPTSYDFSHLEREGKTIWDGVHNALALKHLRSMRSGDLAFFYESGKVRSIVGVMRVLSDPRPDPRDPTSFVVEMGSVRRLSHPVPLKLVKANPKFKGFALVRLSRLSVMPVPKNVWNALLELERVHLEGTSGNVKSRSPNQKDKVFEP